MTKKFITGSLILMMCMGLLALVNAQEPSKPYVKASFSASKESEIDVLKALSVTNVIDKLKEITFIVEEDYLNKSIYVAFSNRSQEAIDAALDLLKLPREQIVENKKIDRTKELFVAKRILQVFPNESMARISAIYQEGSATMKSNLIEALGNMADLQARNMLISALDDKTFFEKADPENIGEPMRICDAAYNQLVLRYMMPDVLRTIGSVHPLEQRDYHISVLKQKI